MSKQILLISAILFMSNIWGQGKLIDLRRDADYKTYKYPTEKKMRLEVIKLTINQLSSGKPLELESYENLQVLRIENSQLGTIAIDFDRNPLLQSIYISNCEYDSLVITGSSVNMKQLMLYDKHFYNYDFLQKLPALEGFHISDTMTMPIDNMISNLLNLKKLNSLSLYDGNITLLPESFASFEKLEWFSVRWVDSNFNYEALFERIKNTGITDLDLMFNPCTTLPSNIRVLKNVKRLHLSSSALKSLPEEIGELTQLEEISASETNLDTIPNSFIKLTNLKILGIMPCNFKTIPQILYQMTWLEKLDVGSMDWFPTDAELKPLRKKLKGCKVNEFGE
jgi:Leucine-rich repeat (LRR) protein